MSPVSRFSQTINWRLALGEFVLIVAGVLVALTVDSWWESRENAARERTYLVQLLADTRENARRIDAAIAEDSVANARARFFQRILDPSRPLPPEDSLPNAFRGVEAFENPDFRPLLGTYNALLEAGDLQLLRDPSIRFRIVAYLSSIETTRDVVRQSSEHIREREDAFMRELLSRLRSGQGMHGGPRSAMLPLRGNQNATLALGSAMATRGQRLRTLRSLREEGQALIQALEGEIGADASAPSATDSVRFPERGGDPRRS